MTDDLISRQAAIDLFPNDALEWDTNGGYIAPHLARQIIEELPSAQRKGKWIVEWETDDTRMLRCSECRMVFNVGKGRDGNYCPNCGCRMVEE